MGCQFDMCGLASNATLQNAYKCDLFAGFNQKCNALLTNTIQWRDKTNCRKFNPLNYIIN